MQSQKSYSLIKYFITMWLMFLVISAIVMFLWNWLLPEIFGIKKISYLESAGLLLLSKILFGGFNKEHFKKKFLEKQEEAQFVSTKKQTHLTEEQKSMLKNKFYSKWCKTIKEEDFQA